MGNKKDNKNTQSRLIDVNALEIPQSRAEAYLHYIIGSGKILFNQLPNPVSRIDYLLMYICEQIFAGNIGGGGGGQLPLDTLVGVTWNPIDNSIDFTKLDGTIVPISLNGFAQLDKENVFENTNWFDNIILDKVSSLANTHYGNIGGGTSRRYFGIREQSSDLFAGYISHVRVYISQAYAGTSVSGVSVHQVEKRASDKEDIYKGVLVNDSIFSVITEGGRKYIEIPIRKYFENETYLLVYTTSGGAFESISGVGGNLHPNIINMPNIPNINNPIQNSTEKYVAHMETFGALNIKDAFTNNKALIDFIIKELNDLIIEVSVLDKESAKINEDNTFTKENVFENYRPKVSKNFTLKAFGEGLATNPNNLLPNNSYCADLTHKFKSDKSVSHLLVPIVGATVGEKIFASYFVVESNTGIVKEIYNNYIAYDVEDVEYVGCKCIRIPVNKVYNAYEVSFGVRIQNKGNIGLSLANAGANISWVDATIPQVNMKLTGNSSTTFSYKVVQHTTSEVITKFDVDNLDNYVKRDELTKVGGDATHKDKIPQLNDKGKVDISMIPDLSINKIHPADNEGMANDLINNGTVKIGDTIIVKDTGTVYLYVNDKGATFNDKTIEIAFAKGSVKMVNGEIPNPQGNVTVKSEHIPYDKNVSQLNSTDVQGAIDELVIKMNESFKDATYNINNQKLMLTRGNGNVKEVSLDDLASKTLDNVFKGNNTFKDIVLGIPNTITSAWVGGTHHGSAPNSIKIGDRKISSHASNSSGYVKNLLIRVGDSKTIDEVVNVNVWEVTKGVDKTQDIPKQLYKNLELKIIDANAHWGADSRALICPINKKYNEDTYFIYQIVQPSVLYRISNPNPTSEDNISLDQNVEVTQQNIANSGTERACQCALEQGDIGIFDLVSANAGKGTVTNINGQTPNDLGEVTINAENINYDDALIGLGGVNVQDAIRLLNDKIGTSTAGVSDVTYDNDKTLTITKNGQQNQIDLTPLVGVKTINGQAGTNGAINLSVNNTTNRVEFKVDNNTFATLDYMTEQQADDIINAWN